MNWVDAMVIMVIALIIGVVITIALLTRQNSLLVKIGLSVLGGMAGYRIKSMTSK